MVRIGAPDDAVVPSLLARVGYSRHEPVPLTPPLRVGAEGRVPVVGSDDVDPELVAVAGWVPARDLDIEEKIETVSGYLAAS